MPINQPLNKPTSKLALVIVIFSLTTCLPAQDGQQATGRVYHDKNFNNQYDTGEPLLSGIRVSNGESIVTTDSTGSYELAISDDTILFVIKPQGWRTPVNEDQIPQFYYIHKPAGSPVGYRFKGVSPTGPLPKSVDFPLYPQKEPDNFKAIMFADPQPRNQQEVDYVIREVVEEIIGTDAVFGVTLGDIMFNNLDLFGPQNQGIALIGIPWYNVIGNHDNNAEAPSDELSDETFERIYGPAYYSFDYRSEERR
ncbi:MAG: metallophosphoesterase N-terminal domain-containing protein, partial [Pirellulaceae bacterium]